MKKRKRKQQKSSKKLLLLAILVLTVGIGFAALQKYLTINGTASIDSDFDVSIAGIRKVDTIGNAYEKSEATYTDTTASFDVGLMVPGDSITYDINVAQRGNLNAKLEEIIVDEIGSKNITYEVTGLSKGDILSSGDIKNVRVKISYTGTETSEVSKSLNVTMLFKQTSELTEGEAELLEGYESFVPEFNVAIANFEPEGATLYMNGGWDEYSHISETMNLYNNDSLVQKGISEYKLFYNTNYSLKYSRNVQINGIRKTTQLSNSKNFYLALLDDYFVANKDNENNTYEFIGIVNNYNSSELTLPINYNISSFSSNFIGPISTINKVIIPAGFDLTKLEPTIFSNPSINTIVNNSGDSIDWAPIIGSYETRDIICEFETGTCGNVSIITE